MEINWLSFTTVMLLIFSILVTLPRIYTFKPQEKIVYTEYNGAKINKEAINEFPITGWTKMISYRRVGCQLQFESNASIKDWYTIIPILFPDLSLDKLSLKVWDNGRQASICVKGWSKSDSEK
jgi:hypothetical protein